MSKDLGGQAFPLPCTSDVAGGVHWAEEGMTLRDYFAACMLMNASNLGSPEQISKWSYQVANAMIAERAK